MPRNLDSSTTGIGDPYKCKTGQKCTHCVFDYIEHHYNGWISTLNKTIQSYKHRQFTCFNNFLKKQNSHPYCVPIST